MKSVLWISRHQMTNDQLSDLERIAQDDINIMQWKDTLTDLSPVEPMVRRADIIAAVLPLDLIAQLKQLAGDTPVLIAVSKRIPTGRIHTLPDGREEQEFQFVHGGWEQIVELQLVTKLL